MPGLPLNHDGAAPPPLPPLPRCCAARWLCLVNMELRSSVATLARPLRHMAGQGQYRIG